MKMTDDKGNPLKLEEIVRQLWIRSVPVKYLADGVFNGDIPGADYALAVAVRSLAEDLDTIVEEKEIG